MAAGGNKLTDYCVKSRKDKTGEWKKGREFPITIADENPLKSNASFPCERNDGKLTSFSFCRHLFSATPLKQTLKACIIIMNQLNLVALSLVLIVSTSGIIAAPANMDGK